MFKISDNLQKLRQVSSDLDHSPDTRIIRGRKIISNKVYSECFPFYSYGRLRIISRPLLIYRKEKDLIFIEDIY